MAKSAALRDLRAPAAPAAAPIASADAGGDYLVRRDGVAFAGTHLLIDLWQGSGLDDLGLVETALREAVAATGATLLRLDLHHFSPNGGISGVAVLAESHMSIHTWPERAYAALDVFVCGACDPYRALPVLRRHFRPASVQIAEMKRGLMP